ncbi:MAG: glucose 1-dehydrogenase [Acidimicrobiia bacterium]|nr:glucose 1-dehydrogenase [Acidimicrobiia bacterium]
MGQELSGKVAIVTGGAGGIGRAIVERFVTEDAKVVVADVDADAGERLVNELGAAVAFQRTDVASADDVQAVVDFAIERFGGLHVMCNNAGISSSRRRFLDDDLRDFDAVMRVNVLGVMLGCQRAARHMTEHGGGSIINTTSIGGINAGAGLMTYRASKAAVVHLSQSIAIDLAEHGIRVNCVAPAHIATAINASYDQTSIVRAMQPLQRMGAPSDVAEAMLFLASDRSAQITGIVLPVDGGTTAGPPPADIAKLLSTRPTGTPT